MPFIPPRNLSIFNELCGTAKKVILVTTRWSGVQELEGQKREIELSRKYWKQMMRQGSRVVRFRDSQESAWKIVTSIIGKASPKDQHTHREKAAFVSTGTPSRKTQSMPSWQDPPIFPSKSSRNRKNSEEDLTSGCVIS
jgi:hypothetical protein